MEISSPYFPGYVPVDAYGNGGFRFAEMSHQGSVLMLPSGVHGWHPNSVAEITPDSFQALRSCAENVDVLLIGCGTDVSRPLPAVYELLDELSIVPEIMNTGAAARTYNVLLAEKRSVAAALIAVENP